MQRLYKFPSIERFHNKCVQGRKYPVGEQVFLIKPKLHGSNCGIVIPPGSDDKTSVQTRKNPITTDSDHHGFANWWHRGDNVDHIVNDTNETIVIFGEWCGQGIQSKDAITKIDRKVFAPFAIVTYDDSNYEEVNGMARPYPLDIFVDPMDIENMLVELGFQDFDDIVIIDAIKTFIINFNDQDNVDTVKHVLTEMVEEAAKQDSWVKSTFGVDGVGEGFVGVPKTKNPDFYATWSFKVKTAAHDGKGNKAKNKVNSEPTVSPTVRHFVEQFANESRFEQAVEELGGRDEMTTMYMGQFLKWVGQDIVKESKDELEVSGLEWKDVSKHVTNVSRQWFLKHFS